MQKVEQKDQGKPEGSARFALPAHSNSHYALIIVNLLISLCDVSVFFEKSK